MSDATATMTRLLSERDQAQSRLAKIEADQRAAHEALLSARDPLVPFERRGDGAAERAKFEKALAAAEARAAEPWPLRECRVLAKR